MEKNFDITTEKEVFKDRIDAFGKKVMDYMFDNNINYPEDETNPIVVKAKELILMRYEVGKCATQEELKVLEKKFEQKRGYFNEVL